MEGDLCARISQWEICLEWSCPQPNSMPSEIFFEWKMLSSSKWMKTLVTRVCMPEFFSYFVGGVLFFLRVVWCDVMLKIKSIAFYCHCLGLIYIILYSLLAWVDILIYVARSWLWKCLCRGISSEEKLHLRQKLLSHLREEDYKVVLMLMDVDQLVTL